MSDPIEVIALHSYGKHKKIFQDITVGCNGYRRVIDRRESYIVAYPTPDNGIAVLLGQDDDGTAMTGENDYFEPCYLGYDLFGVSE